MNYNWKLNPFPPLFLCPALSCISFSSHLIWICLISAISQSRFKNLHLSATNPVWKSESRTGSTLFHSTHPFHRHTCNLTPIIWLQHLLEVISCKEELFDSHNKQWEGSLSYKMMPLHAPVSSCVKLVYTHSSAASLWSTTSLSLIVYVHDHIIQNLMSCCMLKHGI